MKRQVYVIEGRRKSRPGDAWAVQRVAYRLLDAFIALRAYRCAHSPKHEFRVTTYAPKGGK